VNSSAKEREKKKIGKSYFTGDATHGERGRKKKNKDDSPSSTKKGGGVFVERGRGKGVAHHLGVKVEGKRQQIFSGERGKKKRRSTSNKNTTGAGGACSERGNSKYCL